MMAGRAGFEDHPNQNRQGRSGQSHLRLTSQLSSYGKNGCEETD